MGLSGTVWPLHMGMIENGCSFREIFFDHVTKPMVWGHSGGMGHTGTYFLEVYIVVDISADKRDVQTNKK